MIRTTMLSGLAALALVAPAAPQAPASAELFTRVQDGVVRAAIKIELQGDWHIYHKELGHPKAVGQPTKIELSGEGIEWSEVWFPEPIRLDQSDVAGEGAFILAHEHELVVYAAGKLTAPATGQDVKAKIRGLVCEDVQGCIPYRQEVGSKGPGDDALFAKFPADLKPPGSGSAAPAGVEPSPGDTPSSAKGASSPADPPAIPAGGASGPSSAAGTSEVPAVTSGAGGIGALPAQAEEGLLAFLLLAVGGGLFALVMPCTYPMIPITISFFTKQAEKRGGTPLGLSLAYGAGIVLIFVVVGAVFGSLIKPFAASPIVNLALGLAFVYFSFVLFGALHLEPPRALMNVAGAASTKGGYLGVFLMGATLVVTSFTCTAPFVGSLLSVGATGGDVGRVALGMTVFGLTMAVPFVLLSLIPGRVKAIPRSGEWMNTVKVTLGFVELAAALKFFSNADLVWQWGWLSRELFLAFWTGIFGVAALYLFGMIRLSGAQGEISPPRLVAGLCFALFALYCGNGAAGSTMDAVMTAIIPNYTTRVAKGGEAARKHTIVVDDYEAARARARAENKLLLVNFTGYT